MTEIIGYVTEEEQRVYSAALRKETLFGLDISNEGKLRELVEKHGKLTPKETKLFNMKRLLEDISWSTMNSSKMIISPQRCNPLFEILF
jgi:hypothetical protein